MAEPIEIVEVSPRDGLQTDPQPVPTPVKLELIERARQAGLRRLEVTSFVHPKRVPQMADAEAVMQATRQRFPDLDAIGLVLNRRGFDRAAAAGCRSINFVVAATDAFCRRNQGFSLDEGMAIWDEVAPLAKAAGMQAGLTIGVSFGCPFEGEVPAARVLEIMARGLAAGPDEIAFADTIGCGVPSQVRTIFTEARRSLPAAVKLRGHFHNTRNTGLANVLAAVESGAAAIDASIGGVGGCPFAPAATGNVATEDVAYMLSRMGLDVGLDIDALVAAGRWLEPFLSRKLEGGVTRAGNFPAAPSMPAAAD